MPSHVRLELLRRLIEEDFGNDQLFNELYSDCAYHEASGKTLRGDEVRAFRSAFVRGFSEIKNRIEDVSATDDTVWMRWTFSGVNTGEFNGAPATGKRVSIPIFTVSRFRDGKIAEEWELSDAPGMARQLGDESEANTALAKRYFEEVVNGRKLELLDEIFSADCVLKSGHLPAMKGSEARRRFMTEHFESFGDIGYTMDDIVASGNVVVIRWTAKATLKQAWAGMPPGDLVQQVPGVSLFRFADGKIVEEIGFWDGYSMKKGTEERNKEVVRLYCDLFNQHDMSRLPEVLAEDFHGLGTAVPEMRGIAARRQLSEAIFAAMPDVRIHMEEMVADGNTVVARWHEIGTLTGEWAGIAATGKTASFEGMSIFRLRDGKIAEEHLLFDALGMYQQIGVLPGTPFSTADSVH